MASVKLRKRKNADGTTSLFLDIYTYYKDSSGKGKARRRYEFLDECKLLKPTSPIDKAENKSRLNLAEQIRNKRETELLTRSHDLVFLNKQETYFKDFCSEFLEDYTKKNKKNVRATIAHFFTYLKEKGLPESIFCNELTAGHCEGYLDYLEQEFNGETIETYFRLFKRIIRSAYKNGFITKDVCQDVVCKKGTPAVRDILDFEEIAQLAQAHCPNKEVKRAFLFSCYTGLRWGDVKVLKWANITRDGRLKLVQGKTRHAIDNQLHDIALQLLGEAGKPDEYVFNLPSHAGSNKSLKKWCFNAGIHDKNITWHCARHSFGTNIIYYGGADVKTASEMLGHTDLTYTTRYTHAVEALKQRAIEKLPSIEI